MGKPKDAIWEKFGASYKQGEAEEVMDKSNIYEWGSSSVV